MERMDVGEILLYTQVIRCGVSKRKKVCMCAGIFQFRANRNRQLLESAIMLSATSTRDDTAFNFSIQKKKRTGGIAAGG